MLGLTLQNINVAIKATNKGISVIIKLHLSLPRASQLIIYKSFAWPYLGYGNVICDQNCNFTLWDKIESVQYNVSVAITGAITGTFIEKLYQELSLES